MEPLFDIAEKPNTFFGNMHGQEHSKTEWLTDPKIIHALGEFDLDPCAPVVRPWPMANHHFTIEDDAFKQKWFGRKWMNPPYQEAEQPCAKTCKKKVCPKRGFHIDKHIPGTADWMKLLASEGNGIALVFARTETGIFFPHVWDKADAVFFFNKRLVFYHTDGTPATTKDGKPSSGGAPSCLVAYGQNNVEAIRASGLGGKLVIL